MQKKSRNSRGNTQAMETHFYTTYLAVQKKKANTKVKKANTTVKKAKLR